MLATGAGQLLVRLLGLALACWLVSSELYAVTPPRVEIVTAGAADDTKQLEAVLRELIGHLQVKPSYARTDSVDPTTVLTPDPNARPALARVWIDISGRERAVVYIVDGPWERVLVRNIPIKNGIDEVAREQIAQIVSATIDALSSGARIGLTREEVERELLGERKSKPRETAGTPSEAKASPPASETGSSPSPTEDYSGRDIYDWQGPKLEGPPLDLGLGYEAQTWSTDAPVVHGPQATIYSGFRRARSGPGVWVTLQYRFPVTVDKPPIGVRLNSGGVRLLATYDFGIANRTEARAGAGLGFDLVNVQPREITAGGDVHLTQERTTFVPLARAIVAVQHRILQNTALIAALALDVELENARYVVDRASSKDLVFDPWTLRPALVVGIAVDLIAPP